MCNETLTKFLIPILFPQGGIRGIWILIISIPGLMLYLESGKAWKDTVSTE